MFVDMSKYCIILSELMDELSGCSRELLYYGWCDANKYVFELGCLVKYLMMDFLVCLNCNFDLYLIVYWSVGVLYFLYFGMVNYVF